MTDAHYTAEEMRKLPAWVEAELRCITDNVDAIRGELLRLYEADAARLAEALRECADSLEAEIEARRAGELPRRIERDLEPVRNARALLIAHDAKAQPPAAHE